MPAKGQKMSEESKAKLSATQKSKRTGWKHSEETKAKMSATQKGRKFSEEHIANLKASMATDESKKKRSEIFKGRVFTEETKLKMSASAKVRKISDEGRRKRSESMKKRTGEKSTRWKGGVKKLQTPLFDTYAHQLSFVESVRRNPEEERFIQVRCTYCGKWFQPTTRAIHSRIIALTHPKKNEELRFYCPGKECRSQCSIFNQVKYPKGYSPSTSREVQPELRKLVFERDNYACQKCGATSPLHCHHIDPVANNPIESTDIDNCITLCKPCHKEAHKIPGCSGQELRCRGTS